MMSNNVKTATDANGENGHEHELPVNGNLRRLVASDPDMVGILRNLRTKVEDPKVGGFDLADTFARALTHRFHDSHGYTFLTHKGRKYVRIEQVHDAHGLDGTYMFMDGTGNVYMSAGRRPAAGVRYTRAELPTALVVADAFGSFLYDSYVSRLRTRTAEVSHSENGTAAAV